MAAQVTSLATAALQTTDSGSVKATAETLLGRAAHARADLKAAFGHYRKVMPRVCAVHL